MLQISQALQSFCETCRLQCFVQDEEWMGFPPTVLSSAPYSASHSVEHVRKHQLCECVWEWLWNEDGTTWGLDGPAGFWHKCSIISWCFNTSRCDFPPPETVSNLPDWFCYLYFPKGLWISLERGISKLFGNLCIVCESSVCNGYPDDLLHLS